MQESFLDFLANYLADCIPENSPEARLKPKFKTWREGRASTLPPSLDLLLVYQKTLKQVGRIKALLKDLPDADSGFTREQKEWLLTSAPRHLFRWLVYVERGDITLRQIHRNTAQSTTVLILMLQYSIGEDMLRTRMFRTT